MQCMRHKEKCKWLEMMRLVSGSGSGDVKGKEKGKEKEVVMSPRASKKKKCIKKSAAKVVDSDVEVVARPIPVTRSRTGHVLLKRMDHLILAVENLMEAQWYMASGVVVGTLVDKCTFLGFKGVGPGEENEEETDMEAVNQEVIKQEVLEPQPSDNKM